MIGRSAAIGLSLLCALVACAFAAPSAIAIKSGTAYFTCVKDQGKGDWEDAHCTRGKANSYFKHVLFFGKTRVATINVLGEAFILQGEVAGSKFEINLESLLGAGEIENTGGEEAMTGVGEWSGTGWLGTVIKPSIKCGVIGGIFEPLVSKTKEMEVEFKPESGTVFAEFEFFEKEKSCALKGVRVKVEGSASSSPEGGLLRFTKASTEASKEVCEGKKSGPGLCAAKNRRP